jgi:hypothetical protein
VAWKGYRWQSRSRYDSNYIHHLEFPFNIDLDENHELDPPETPAPVFAARALKSAIFGAPALTDDETIYESDQDIKSVENTKTESHNFSPTKPAGILLTPGTGTTRRKTVSFGNEIVDRDEGKQMEGKPNGRSGLADDCPGKFPSPWTSKAESSRKSVRKTPLTRQFESAREGKSGRTGSEVKRNSSEFNRLLNDASKTEGNEGAKEPRMKNIGLLQKGNQELLQELASKNTDPDMTVDLNEPHSQSGQYWKSEYEQYHEQAILEMKKLAHYKVLAKDYAMMKDTEALNLAVKLKDEQKKVIAMEDKISQLSAKIAASGTEENDEDSPELIKELARQTALAVQYKGRVEEFRKAVEGKDSQVSKINGGQDGKHFASPRTEQTLLDTHRELKKAREQLKEMASLEEEMHSLRRALTVAQKSATKLQDDNAKLSQELLHADLRLERQVEKSEKKRRSFDEYRQKKDEIYQNLQRDYDKLKEQAKSQRHNAEQLLKQRHDQVVELKKQIVSLRASDSSAQDFQRILEKKTDEHNEIVAGYRKQIEKLEEYRKANEAKQKAKGKDILPLSQLQSSFPPGELPHTKESQIPILSQSLARTSNILASSKPTGLETSSTPRQRPSQSALSEIINNASVDGVPPQWTGPVHHTPLVQMTPVKKHPSNISLESPQLDLPSPEPSPQLPTEKHIQERNYQASPRPSMFNIPSSPPKAAMVRPRASDNFARQKSHNGLSHHRLANMASSRLSSMESSRARGFIPPERAAAAKARLEQKQAEKRRMQALGADKENSRN